MIIRICGWNNGWKIMVGYCGYWFVLVLLVLILLLISFFFFYFFGKIGWEWMLMVVMCWYVFFMVCGFWFCLVWCWFFVLVWWVCWWGCYKVIMVVKLIFGDNVLLKYGWGCWCCFWLFYFLVLYSLIFGGCW